MYAGSTFNVQRSTFTDDVGNHRGEYKHEGEFGHYIMAAELKGTNLTPLMDENKFRRKRDEKNVENRGTYLSLKN